jgi:two-component SAPR family response regulator
VEECGPEIVFMDVELPGLNGVACAQRIRESHPELCFIFVTAREEFMPRIIWSSPLKWSGFFKPWNGLAS